MCKINKDDIAAITSRMDAAMVVMIELTAEAHKMDVSDTKSRYTKKYDVLAETFRKKAIVEDN